MGIFCHLNCLTFHIRTVHINSTMAKCVKFLLLAAVCLIAAQASQVPRRLLEETSDMVGDMVQKGMDEVTAGLKEAAEGVSDEITGMMDMKKDGDTETDETGTDDDTGSDDDTAMMGEETDEGDDTSETPMPET